MADPDVLLRRAHEAGYRFPSNFGGFSASVRTSAGDVGTVNVTGRTDIELTVDGTPSDEVAWARDELASIVGHRWATGYDGGDGRWAKRLDGETVRMLDDPFDSSYRLQDNHIREVHRTVGPTRFVISVSERVRTGDGRHLPVHFTVFFWNTEDNRLTRADHFTDSFVLVDGVYLPSRRQIVSAGDDGLTTRVLELRDHTVHEDLVPDNPVPDNRAPEHQVTGDA